MKNLVLLLVMLMAGPLSAQRATSVVLDDWELIAQNAVREGATQNLTTWQNTTVHIALAVTSITAHTGTKLAIQLSNVDNGDENWYTYTEFIGPVGTASPTSMTVIPDADATSFTVNTPTGRFDDDGIRQIFLLGSPTVVNSEICTLVSHVAGTSGSITVVDPLANTPGTGTTFWDLAETYVVELPKNNNRIRILYDNTYDSNGSIVYTYCTIYGIRP